MSVTIDSLDIQIRSSAGSAAANIDRLADALGKMRANAKLTTVTNNLNKLSEALGKLQGTSSGLNNIRGLAGAMKSLSQVEKGSGFNSLVNTLKKLPDIVNQLDANTLGAFSAKMRELAAALAPLASQLDRVGRSFANLPARISQIVTGTNRMASASRSAAAAQDDHNDSLNAMSINLAAGISNIQSLIGVLHTVRDQMAAILSDAIEWDGIQFRFGRAFGEDADETYDYVMKISEALKINAQQFMQYSSLYGSLLQGFGLTQDKVTTIAVGLTELSYDIWAAYNDRFKTLEDASEAVRSAITGEIEPIRNAGIALTEASLQEYLDSIGMATVSIEKLTEAQKAEVRYAAMVKAAMQQGIVGTYAREMQTAEGAVRTLTQQIKTLGQAFGSLFIPILQVVVPWITAFVSILTDAIEVVAKFFGIPFFKIQWDTGSVSGGVSDLKEGADAATGSLGDATKAAKKLKQTTMGFDELNVISPDSDSAGGGAGGAGGAGVGDGWGDGLDLDKLWDDSIFQDASKKVDEIKEKLKDILAFAGIIGAAFVAWKIAKSFMTALDAVKLGLKVIAGQNGVMGMTGASSALTLLTSPKTAAAVQKLGDILRKTQIGAMILGSGSTSMGAAAVALGAVLAAVAALAGGLIIVFKESENFRNGLVAIKDGVVWVFKKIGEILSWLGDKFSQFGKAVKEKLTGIVPEGVLEFFDNLDIGIGDLLITAGGLALFGPLGLLIEGAVLAIKGIGYAASDALPSVNLFGEGISKATQEKVEPFLEKMGELENSLATLDWGNAIVTDSDLESISAKLKAVTDVIISELDSDKNEALAKLHPLKAALSDEKYTELLAKIEESYTNRKQIVTDGEARINEILATASAEARALTDAEAAEIAKIQEGMKTTGIKYLSESETESNLILKRLKDNASLLTAEQASAVVKNAISARDKTIKAAEEQYKGILLEAQRLLDTGMINEDEYAEIVSVAESARDETVSAAEKQYGDILTTAQTQMGKYSKYLDEETGEIKSNWDVFCDDVAEKWEDAWGGIKTWWNDNMAKFFTKKYWTDTFDNVKQGISEKLDEVKQSISDKWDSVKAWYYKNVAPKLTKEFWLDKFSNLKSGFTQTIKNMLNAGIEMFNKFIGWLNSKLKFSWDAITIMGKTIVPAGSVQLFTIPLITQRFADGGFIEDGLFTMNHGEIAGKFSNGQSVVANNQQIVEGIAAGVYEAVIAAMSTTGGRQDQNVNVYLDGKQIYASVKKTESERGRTLMGNQLGYAY